MQKNHSKKKTVGETRLNSFKCIFRKSEDIVSAIYWKYSQTCIRRPRFGPFKKGCLRQVVALWNTSIKRPLTKCGRFWQFLVFSHGNICLSKKRFVSAHVLVSLLKIKNVLSYFSFRTYIYQEARIAVSL